MTTVLEIEDGNPWWLSHDIWVVPGNDPSGAPGQPVAGQAAFLWARVHNKGEEAALGARVNFYWSNPATGVLRSNSTMVGTSFVDLSPMETKDVLCIIPWIPVIVNEGHECVVAEVIHHSDPLPSPLPDPFDPPNHRQVAQRNLTVIAMRRTMMRILPIQVAAPKRTAKRLFITAEIGEALDERLLAQLDLSDYQAARGSELKLGLSLEPGCGEEAERDLAREIDVTLEPGTARAVYLRVWPPDLEPYTYVPLHITSHSDENLEGGITYIVVKQEEQ